MNKSKLFFCLPLLLFMFFGIAKSASAASPALFFSDLIDGPNVGLTDDQVSNQGAIVTIWGHNLGSSQRTSKVYVGSDGSGWTEAVHVYYWGNADGSSNGVHADLYTKQGMQEISFAISSSTAIGAQKIKVVVDGADSDQLDFYVRSTGNIFFVKTTGSDSNNGSWATPWLTINKATSSETGTHMHAGDIVYVCDGISASGTNPIDIGANARKHGAINNMMGLITYPGATVMSTATGTGIRNYYFDNSYWVISKFFIDTASTGITIPRYSRAVGNRITGSSADGQSGALNAGVSTNDGISGIKALGNYIHDFGSSSTSNKHHTTYFLIRAPITIPGIEIAWNYLKDNHARYGIHYYDEAHVGSFSTPCSIHDNWVENQSGSGVNIGTQPDDFTYAEFATGTWYVYNNVLVNCGLTANQGIGANAQAMAFYGEQNTFNIYAYNNTIYGYGETGNSTSAAISVPLSGYGQFGGIWAFENNIIFDTKNYPWSYSNSDNIKIPTISSNNIFYNGGDDNPASPPSWDTNPITSNPLFVNPSSNNFSLQSTSPAINAGSSLVSSIVSKDFFGLSRPQGTGYDIGAYEYDENTPSDSTAPSVPGGLSVR